jgi:hypothetical protein
LQPEREQRRRYAADEEPQIVVVMQSNLARCCREPPPIPNLNGVPSVGEFVESAPERCSDCPLVAPSGLARDVDRDVEDSKNVCLSTAPASERP